MSIVNFDDMHMKMAGRIKELESLIKQADYHLEESAKDPDRNNWINQKLVRDDIANYFERYYP